MIRCTVKWTHVVFIIIVSVHGIVFLIVKVCEDSLGFVQSHLSRGCPLECSRRTVFVAHQTVSGAPVGRALRHLGLEPVDAVLPLGGVLQQLLLHRQTLAGG